MKPLFCVTLAVVVPCLPNRALDLYVSNQGNDAWTGKLVAPDAARTDGPFASLERARDAIRQLKSAGLLREAVTVQVRGGLYALPRTLRLTAEDSGTASALIVYRAYQQEKPILIGGKQITGFVPHTDGVLKADVGAQGFNGIYFRQLIFDGKRQHLARYPNFDPRNPYGGGWAYADGKPVPMYADVPGENRRTLHYRAADARTWSSPTEGEVFAFPRYNWWNNIVRIASRDTEQRLITLAGDCSYPIRPGDRYYVRNLLEELDAPGEWYLDRQTWTLYFWPPAPLAGRAVYAPTLRTILGLGPGTAHVTFRGFTFECSDGTAIELKQTTNCLIAAGTIRNVGDYNGSGVSINGGARNGVVGCDLFEIGSSAIDIAGGNRTTLTPAGNFADNNYIHHTGVFYKQGVGINLSGCGNRASHNFIHDCPRFGIGFAGNNLLIEYNHLRHVNLETADTGAVYTGGRDWLGSRGTVIRHNYFHDVLGYGLENGKWVSPHYAWGIYLDDNTGGVDVIGNIVARAVRGLIHLHNGRDNLVENNIFVDGVLQQIECNGWTASHSYWSSHLGTMIRGYESVMNQPAWRQMRNMHLHPTNAVLPDGTVMSGNTFRRNIVSGQDPKAKYVGLRNISFEHNQFDSNLVWHAGQPVLTGQSRVGRNLSANRLINPGFEDGDLGKLPKGWWWQAHPGNSAAVVTDQTSASGSRAFRIDGARSQDAKGKEVFPSLGGARVPGKAGQAYRLSARLKSTKPNTRVTLAGQSHVPNVYFWAKDTALRVGTNWQTYEVIFKLPAEGEPGWHRQMTNVEVSLAFREPDGALFVDDLALHEAESLDEWTSWQELGMDRNSVVADPRFVNPAQDDYRLQSDSPAFKLGFQSIPVEQIGPYRDDLRATWPIVEAEGAREKPLMREGH